MTCCSVVAIEKSLRILTSHLLAQVQHIVELAEILRAILGRGQTKEWMVGKADSPKS